MSRLTLIAALAAAVLSNNGSDLAAQPAPASPAEIPVFEAYPDAVLAKLELRDRLLANLRGSASDATLQFVVTDARRWEPASTIRVAFNGGSDALRTQIESAVGPWLQASNLALSFRHPSSGAWREWATSDTDYVAEIRISFDYAGYWSLVGRDSVQSSIVGPGEPSMNFGGFPYQLPATWNATVLHEFGHALGFQHEHQHPLEGCDAEFRWADDSGYQLTVGSGGSYVTDSAGRRPGIYTLLGGPPNSWPKSKVDHNLRQLADSHAYTVSPFDRHSIMKYYFPTWMFVSGEASRCYSGSQNVALSSGDKEGASHLYPRDESARRALLASRTQRTRELLELQGLSPEAEKRVRPKGRELLQ